MEETRQQLGIVHVRAVCRVAIASRARMDAQPLSLRGRQPTQREVVQIDEAREQRPRWVDLQRQACFREIDLHRGRALREAATNFGDMFGHQVLDEVLARIAWDRLVRVHQTQGGGRNDSLLQWHTCMFQRFIEIAISIAPIAKGAAREPWHAAHMAGGEWDAKAIRGGVRQALDAISPEVVIFALLPIGDHGRTGRFELQDSVAHGGCVEGVKARVHAIAARCDGVDQLSRARNTADGFGRNSHAVSLVRGQP